MNARKIISDYLYMLHMMSRLNRFYRKKLIRWWILRFSYAAVDILHLDTGVGKPLGSTPELVSRRALLHKLNGANRILGNIFAF